MKRYEVIISIDSTDNEDKVRLFIMRALSQVIATGFHNRYREDTLNLKIKEGEAIPDKIILRPTLTMILIQVLMCLLWWYGYQKTQGLF